MIRRTVEEVISSPTSSVIISGPRSIRRGDLCCGAGASFLNSDTCGVRGTTCGWWRGRAGGGNVGVISVVHVMEDVGRTAVFLVATATRKIVSKLSTSFM